MARNHDKEKVWISGYFLAKDSRHDDDDEVIDDDDDDFDDIDFGDELVFDSGTSILKSKGLRRCEEKFKEYGSEKVHRIQGLFPMVDPWWNVGMYVQGNHLVGHPSYKIRRDDKIAEEGVVMLFLKDCNVEENDKMAFQDHVRQCGKELTFDNLLQVLKTFAENNKEVSKNIHSRINHSGSGVNVMKSLRFPTLTEILPQLLPRHFREIMSLTDEVLLEIGNILEWHPWMFGFSRILTRKFRIHCCEASFSNFYHCSQVYDRLSSIHKDSLYIYEILKDNCRRDGHTFVPLKNLKRYKMQNKRYSKESPPKYQILDWKTGLEFLEAEDIIKQEQTTTDKNIYLYRYWFAEKEIAEFLGKLMFSNAFSQLEFNVDFESHDFDQIRTDEDQLKAAYLIASKPVVVLSGKGGCGKTEVVSRVFDHVEKVWTRELKNRLLANADFELSKSLSVQDIQLLEQETINQSITTPEFHEIDDQELVEYMNSQKCHEFGSQEISQSIATQGICAPEDEELVQCIANQKCFVFGSQELSQPEVTQVSHEPVGQCVVDENGDKFESCESSLSKSSRDSYEVADQELIQYMTSQECHEFGNRKLNQSTATVDFHDRDQEFDICVAGESGQDFESQKLSQSAAIEDIQRPPGEELVNCLASENNPESDDHDAGLSLSAAIQDFNNSDDQELVHFLQSQDCHTLGDQDLDQSLNAQNCTQPRISPSSETQQSWNSTGLILLTAPTGKAANLLGLRSGGMKGYTLHQVVYSYFAWKRNSNDQCWSFSNVRALVVDESSLVSVTIFQQLLRALSTAAQLSKVILLGDVNQLPSIEPGRFLYDVYESLDQAGCSVALRSNHRSESEFIVQNADRILHQRMPCFDPAKNFYLHNLSENGENVGHVAVKTLLASGALPSHEDSQFVAFRRRDCDVINELCCLYYNNHSIKKRGPKGRQTDDFRIGDKVCCTRNANVKDYSESRQQSTADGVQEIRLCNGEIFFIKDMIEFQEQGKRKFSHVTLSNTYREVTVALDALISCCKLKHAWARTIHTFQGSETDVLVYVVGSLTYYQNWQHVYTAVTRGKKQVHIVTEISSLACAVQKIPRPRNTSLKTRLLNMLSARMQGSPEFSGAMSLKKLGPQQNGVTPSSGDKRKTCTMEHMVDSPSVKHSRVEQLLTPMRRQLSFPSDQ